MTQHDAATAVIMAGVPEANATLYHRIRHSVFDPVVFLDVPCGDGTRRSVLILRDIEGLATERIADILDIVPATARWRIFQARKLFRDVWDKEEPLRAQG